MAGEAEQLTGLFPTIVVAGTATKMTQSLFGSPQQSKRKRAGKRANKRSSGGGPWSGNPLSSGSGPW